MILVDDRAGSKELITPLRRMGLEAESTRLEFGDLAWEGRGEKSRAVMIGIEFKQLEELVQSMRSGRLQGHQLVGMRSGPHPLYDYAYLFYEGELLYNRTGQLLTKGHGHPRVMPGQMTINELLKRIHVLHLCGGLTPWYTTCRRDTLESIVALYRTWTDQDLDQHKSHIAAYEAPSLIPVSDFRRTVKTFPHVGLRGSLAVEQHFKGSLRRATNASEAEWAAIQIVTTQGHPRRLGTSAAREIVAFCKGT